MSSLTSISRFIPQSENRFIPQSEFDVCFTKIEQIENALKASVHRDSIRTEELKQFFKKKANPSLENCVKISNITELPNDLLREISLILNVESIPCLANTCKKFHDISKDELFLKILKERKFYEIEAIRAARIDERLIKLEEDMMTTEELQKFSLYLASAFCVFVCYDKVQGLLTRNILKNFMSGHIFG